LIYKLQGTKNPSKFGNGINFAQRERAFHAVTFPPSHKAMEDKSDSRMKLPPRRPVFLPVAFVLNDF